MTTCLFLATFFRALENLISYISRGHSNGRSRYSRMLYFLTRLSFPPLRIPLTWINSQYRLARVEEKGFSCFEMNVLRTVTIEMIGKFLPLIHPTLSLRSLSPVFATRRELLRRGIALINVSQRTHRRTKFYVCLHQS